MNAGPILIGIPGLELGEETRVQLMHPAVGGVVLFSRNFEDREQLEHLVGSIRAVSDPRPLICIDQEGGRVQRLTEGFTRLPPLGALGGMHGENPLKALDMAYRHGRVMATEMLACGIDLSFAPVLDLDRGSSVIGDRSLSDQPGVVKSLGRAYLAGMHDAGMKTTGKHFPGHGSVLADSHIEDVTDVRSLAEIMRTDMEPFRELSSELDAVMIAHVVYPEVDPLPAGYSPIWLRQILRQQQGYRGVVISDDLGMHAAKSIGDLRARTTRCIEAGCDLALVCQPEDVTVLLEALEEPLGDSSRAITRLYGKPTLDRDELMAVTSEGIREWAHWQRSLERMGEQSWT